MNGDGYRDPTAETAVSRVMRRKDSRSQKERLTERGGFPEKQAQEKPPAAFISPGQ